MSYQDPYHPNQPQAQHTYQNWGHEPWYDNSGGQQQADYVEDVSQNLWHPQQSQDHGQNYQWTPYGDPGDTDKSRAPDSDTQESIDFKYGYSNYQYPPVLPNRRTSQKSVAALPKREPSLKAVSFPAPVQRQYVGVNQGEFVPKRRTPSAYREYRYDNQGRLWTKNGRLRTAGRFCLCTILTGLFLVVSIALSLVLWMRPPNVQIGQVQSNSGLQRLSSGGIQTNLSVVIAVKNFNYFDVDMRKIRVEVFYPIGNVPVGGGTATDILFKSRTQTNFTFPFSLTYDPSSDTSGQVLSDLARKCGVGGQRSDIKVTYKLTLGIQILLFTVSPVVSNVFNFACPVSSSDISKVFGSS